MIVFPIIAIITFAIILIWHVTKLNNIDDKLDKLEKLIKNKINHDK
jgi:flagellar biogenesis protein FliO